ADLDVRMRVQRQQRRVLARGVDVVEQHAHAHAALGRLPGLVHQQVAGEVVVPDVVLQVQAAPGLARGQGPGGERIQPVGQQDRPGLARVPRQQRLQFAVELGLPRLHRQREAGEAGGRRHQVVGQQHAAAHQHGQREQAPGQDAFDALLHRMPGSWGVVAWRGLVGPGGRGGWGRKCGICATHCPSPRWKGQPRASSGGWPPSRGCHAMPSRTSALETLASAGGGGAPSVAKAWHAGPGCAPRAGRKPPEGRDTPALQLVTSEIIPECAMATPANQLPARQSNATPLRFVTAASLFDGHDAAINIMRRLIQAQGAEVIHLGHNRSVVDVVRAALQEDADAIALSSYQGGHVEYFKYMVDMLRERGAGHIRVVGGGGGTITPEEIRELEAYGVERIYHPNDGMKLGLVEMIEDVVERVSRARDARAAEARQPAGTRPSLDDEIAIGRVLSAIEDGAYSDAELAMLRKQWAAGAAGHAGPTPVIGITGTGGAGKSSVTDELLNRFLSCFPQMRIAVVSVDP